MYKTKEQMDLETQAVRNLQNGWDIRFVGVEHIIYVEKNHRS